jgi:hypothetical protein
MDSLHDRQRRRRDARAQDLHFGLIFASGFLPFAEIAVWLFGNLRFRGLPLVPIFWFAPTIILSISVAFLLTQIDLGRIGFLVHMGEHSTVL